MSLLDKAAKVTSSGGQSHVMALLNECLDARNAEALVATQRLFEDMYDGFTLNTEMKMPAAYCLLAWGEQGLECMMESVRRTPTIKNVSLAMQILASVAAGEKVIRIQWIFSPEMHERVFASVPDWGAVARAARRHLSALVLSFPGDDDAAIAASSAITFLSVSRSDAAKSLLVALATRWLAISTPTLTAYADLIRTSPDDEPLFQSFFEKHPQLLDPMAFQVWTKPDLHGFKEPDFVIRRTDNSYVVVEIETPGKTLMTAASQISAQVTQAVAQSTSYRSFLRERFAEAATVFPSFQDPECLVVIGLEEKLTGGQRAALLHENQHRAALKIVGFDWIASRAAAIAQNIIESRVDVQRIRMV